MVAFSQIFFVRESFDDLHTLKVKFCIFFFASVLFQLTQLRLSFLSMLAPTTTGGMVIEMMEYRAFG